jgi:hypothetical protein
MLRAAALSLLMLITVVTMLPLTSSEASSGERSVAGSHSRKRFRRHSRAWWRRYRARQRRKRAELARRRALSALHAQNQIAATGVAEQSAPAPGGVYNHPRGLWTVKMPEGWSRPATDANEMKFRINTTGQATLSVVGMAGQPPTYALPKRKQNSMLSGVPVTALRRTVIDRMIKEGGWVVNDFQKEINGRQVFVVLAQTPASNNGGAPQVQTYYFTEVDGRIYSLATSAPVDSSDRVAAQSEQMVSSLSQGSRSAQVEASKR